MYDRLLDFLSGYIREVEATIQQVEGAYVERYEEEIVATDRINLRIRVRFQQGHLLELNEAVIGKAGQTEHLGYRYHFQNEQNKLVFRYDNTPHFPGLENFPHHKHIPDKVLALRNLQFSKLLMRQRD